MATLRASYQSGSATATRELPSDPGDPSAEGGDLEASAAAALLTGPGRAARRLPEQWWEYVHAQFGRRLGLGRWGMNELVVALRWLALGVSFGSAALSKPGQSGWLADVGGGTALAAIAVVRTFWRLQVAGDKSGELTAAKRTALDKAGSSFARKRLLGVLVELVVVATVVGVTGTVDSPFLVSLAVACFIAGVALPPALLGAAAVCVIGALAGAGAEGAEPKPVAARAVEGVAVVSALALLGSYSEWLARKARQATDSEVSRLTDLAEVNHLLLELYAKASCVPAALSLKAAVSNLAGRLRQLLRPDVVVLLLAAPVSGRGGESWEVTLADGVELPPLIGRQALAPALLESASSLVPVCRSGLRPGEGVAPGSWTGLYVPLWARNRLTGLLAVERVGPGAPFADGELAMVEGLSQHAGLAIDNARWFRRLRALGAEEERSRLARELHDRVGQSLAYLALCLERLQGEAVSLQGAPARQLSAELGELATEARRAVREVRTKLCDLRTEVTSEHGMASAIEGLLQRVEARSGMTARLFVGDLAPLEPAMAREVVRVAEEAMNNAERHSKGTRLEVRLSWDGSAGTLVVADNGKGLPAMAPLRTDAFGILGMRERADAIGGQLDIRSRAGEGTSVVLRWGESADRG